MQEKNSKGAYYSPEMKVLELRSDVVRTSGGAKITWDDTYWGESADFIGGEF